MAIDETRCKFCIWDDNGTCTGNVTNMALPETAPFYKSHPDITVGFGAGISDDDCVGMQRIPEDIRAVVE